MNIMDNKMQNYLKTKSDRINLTIIFILIYFNLSSLAVTTRISNQTYAILSVVIFFVLFIIKMINIKRIFINKILLVLCLLACILILLNIGIRQDYNILNFVIILQIIIAASFCTLISFNDFIRNYIKIMMFICVYSLVIMYIISPLFPNFSNIFPIRINSAGEIVRDFIFGFKFIGSHSLESRNTGIFREMGVFQIYVNLALVFHLFYLNNTKNKNLITSVFVITIITTLSTVGILELVFILIAYLINNFNKKQWNNLFKSIVVILISFGILTMINPNINASIDSSINKFTEQESSYQVRKASIIGNLMAWSEKPLLGNGINKGLERANELYLAQFSVHNTSTTTSFMAIYGLLFTMIFTIPVILLFMRIRTKLGVKLLLILGFLFAINGQRLIYDQFFYVLYLSYFMRTNQESNKTCAHYQLYNLIKDEREIANV